MEIMVFVTIEQTVGYANVSQGLLVTTVLSVRNNQKKLKKIFQKYVSTMLFKYKQIE